MTEITGIVYYRAFVGIVLREVLRFLQQRERFFSALVRPLVWLVVFAAGFRAVLGIAIQPPYQTYITYDVYIIPGLIAMIQLFNGMQSSLSMVYDREMGSMRVLLTTPLPRWFLLTAKLFAGAAVSVIQVYAFLAVSALLGTTFPAWGYVVALPVMMLTGLMLGALGMFLSSTIKQLENFAGVMNFVIFPTFFLSSALYPLWRMRESSYIVWQLCTYNPFTYAVEALRFALYAKIDPLSMLIVAAALAAFLAGAVWGYNPTRGFTARKGGPAE
ncbi:ABC transporter permease [Methylobrevis albus]|uniref:Transport permease protein n=1 Tax=Methylobrevis albus TaxID=2793297 RepID=A0A931I3P0_9HYPH|nr:ABC transporter permease [Methylobrevis albus]MBH0238288.1 ABC transporter permease [Methylobrevis albus]